MQNTHLFRGLFLICTQQPCIYFNYNSEERIPKSEIYKKWITWGIVACTDTNVCPGQSQVCWAATGDPLSNLRFSFPRFNPRGMNDWPPIIFSNIGSKQRSFCLERFLPCGLHPKNVQIIWEEKTTCRFQRCHHRSLQKKFKSDSGGHLLVSFQWSDSSSEPVIWWLSTRTTCRLSVFRLS